MVRENRKMIDLVALDATVLTNFALVNRPDLISRLWAGIAVTTSATMGEYQAGVVSRQFPENCWVDLPTIALSMEEVELAARLSSSLGEGERTCIALAKSRGGSLATDDLAARRTARQFGIPITGTLGILVACVRRGLLSKLEANQLLTWMVAEGYHSPVDSLDDLLK
jgi:predicted nucleic acid-binding protein